LGGRSEIISSPWQQKEETPRTGKQYEKLSTKIFGKFFQGESIMEHENEVAQKTE